MRRLLAYLYDGLLDWLSRPASAESTLPCARCDGYRLPEDDPSNLPCTCGAQPSRFYA